MTYLRTFFLTSIAFTGFAVSASALPMKAVFTGTVSASADPTNVFGLGTGTGILNGQDYTLSFIFDPSTPGAIRMTNPGVSDTVYGGTSYSGNPPSPGLQVSITINGHTESFNPAYQQYDSTTVPSGQSFHLGFENFNTSSGYVANDAYAYTFGNIPVPASLEQPFAAGNLSSQALGFFELREYDTTLNQYVRNTFGNLVVDTLTISALPVSDVPLPAALPLFAASVGALGLAARRRKRSA